MSPRPAALDTRANVAYLFAGGLPPNPRRKILPIQDEPFTVIYGENRGAKPGETTAARQGLPLVIQQAAARRALGAPAPAFFRFASGPIVAI